MDVNVNTKNATVAGVPLSAFTCWQHGCVDIVSLSRLGTFMRRGCFQKGYIKQNFFAYRPDIVKKKEEGEEESQPAPKEEVKSRFFVISCDIVMDANCPKDPAVMTDTAFGELFVSSVSNSTFTLYLQLGQDSLDEADGSTSKTTSSLGYVQITYCCINDETRRAMPMEEYRRELLAAATNTGRAEALCVAKMQRLQRPDVSREERVFFRHPIPLRDADTDFNGHLNQSMYIAFVIDAVKAHLREVEKNAHLHSPSDGHHGEDDDADKPNTFTMVAPIHDATSSKVVRRLRIDYVREVPSRDAIIEVHLQRTGQREREADVVSHTNEDDSHVHSVWFEIWAKVPIANSNAEKDTIVVEYKEAFMASQGTVEVHSKWL